MPQIYDIALDAFREVTQKDLDLFMAMSQSWGKLRDTQKTDPHLLGSVLDSETHRLMEISRENLGNP